MERSNNAAKSRLSLLIVALLLFGCAAPQPPAGNGQATTTGPHGTGTESPATSPTGLTTTRPPECAAKDCFADAANGCKDISITSNEDFGSAKYTAKNCVFTKTIVSLAAGESQEMKKLLEGKSLSCQYEKGKFNDQWINTLILGIENCEGELRDALGSLSVFASD